MSEDFDPHAIAWDLCYLTFIVPTLGSSVSPTSYGSTPWSHDPIASHLCPVSCRFDLTIGLDMFDILVLGFDLFLFYKISPSPTFGVLSYRPWHHWPMTAKQRGSHFSRLLSLARPKIHMHFLLGWTWSWPFHQTPNLHLNMYSMCMPKLYAHKILNTKADTIVSN